MPGPTLYPSFGPGAPEPANLPTRGADTQPPQPDTSRAELEELLRELGGITMDCEFCNQQYRFGREDLAGVLDDPAPPTLH